MKTIAWTVVVSAFLFALSAFPLQGGDDSRPSGEKNKPEWGDVEYKTTPSGLKYAVLKEGEKGERPGPSDMVKVNYTIWLEDGTVYQTSSKRPEPAKFRVNRVLPGWTEGIQLMTKGAKFRFILPPDLAYGKLGFPPRVPPNAKMIIETELLSFEKGPKLPPFHEGNPEAQKKAPCGLTYEVLKEGKGLKPKKGEVVWVKFANWSLKGELNDCSEIRPGRLCYPLGKSGLRIYNEGVALMREGARYRFIVPPEFAYGSHGAGRRIPPNTTTIWELELVKVFRPLPVPKFLMPPADKLIAMKSGMKYMMVREGKGKRPREDQLVSIHYAGWTAEGKLFEDSYHTGDEKTYILGRLMNGWRQAFGLMREGGACWLVMPAKMAVGPRGPMPKVPRDAKTLVYYLELFKVADRPKKGHPGQETKKPVRKGPPPGSKSLKVGG